MAFQRVITRFAPSPTGFLHIGGARTALFNWLYARNQGGKFLLRIEDTDRARSTAAATHAIIDGLNWLRLDWDGAVVYQNQRIQRHQQVANKMLASGGAYKCFCSKQEIEAQRHYSHKRFHSPWRRAEPSSHPKNKPFVVRLRTPLRGKVTIKDKVQKTISWDVSDFNDLILLRSNGMPTYMFAVVVDDHDMNISHIIRGDDHLINAAQQSLIYRALKWNVPHFAHIPLIHDKNGRKLSKRDGAVNVMDYALMGYTPPAMCNYLARLGWSHGNDELFTLQQAIEWFNLTGLGKSAAKLNLKKLKSVAAYHIKIASDADLRQSTMDYVTAKNMNFTNLQLKKLTEIIPALRQGAKTLEDIIKKAHFILIQTPLNFDYQAQQVIQNFPTELIYRLTSELLNVTWERANIFALIKNFAIEQEIALHIIMKFIRVSLSGKIQAPMGSIMMLALGKNETIARLKATRETDFTPKI